MYCEAKCGETLYIKMEVLIPEYLPTDCISKKCSNLKRSALVDSSFKKRLDQLSLPDSIPEPNHTSQGEVLDSNAQQRIRQLIKNARQGSLTTETDSFEVIEKKRRRLKNISEECISTEYRYLESLRVLNEINSKLHELSSSTCNILTTVFKDIQPMFLLHNLVSGRLHDGKQEVTCRYLVKILSDETIRPFFNIYKSFLGLFAQNYNSLANIYLKDKAFQELCISLVKTSKFEEQRIQDVRGMYMGLQSRLTRCKMLFEKFRENLPPNDLALAATSAVLSTFVSILKFSEAEVISSERRTETRKANEKLEGRRNELSRFSLFINSGPVTKIPRRSIEKRFLERHLFLFTDFLVITEPQSQSGSYLVKSELTIISMQLEEPREDDEIRAPHCFKVKAVENCVELAFASGEEKSRWWTALEEAINNEHRKQDTRGSILPITPQVSDDSELRAAEWVKDEQATMCALCYKGFSVVRRRHHCRVCGKIFCRRCASYKAKLKNLGDDEVRVCEVDYYRINTHLKPSKPADMERLAHFLSSNMNFQPTKSGYLYWASRHNGEWRKQKGAVSETPTSGTKLPIYDFSKAPNSETSASGPHRNSGSPFVLLSSVRKHTYPNLPDDKFAIPRPAACTPVNLSLSKIYCVLQTETLLRMYAAREDAKSKDSIPILGMRLLYLHRVPGNEPPDLASANKSSSLTRLDNLQNIDNDQHFFAADLQSKDNLSLSHSSSPSTLSLSTSSSNIAIANSSHHSSDMKSSESPIFDYSANDKNIVSDNPRLPSYRNTPPPPTQQRSLLSFPENPPRLGAAPLPPPKPQLDPNSFRQSVFTNCSATLRTPAHVETSTLKLSVSSEVATFSASLSEPNSITAESDASAAQMFEVEETIKSIPGPCALLELKRVSHDVLAVLKNTKGFLLLPQSNDTMGHYFEAATEDIRTAWIQSLRQTVIEYLERL